MAADLHNLTQTRRATLCGLGACAFIGPISATANETPFLKTPSLKRGETGIVSRIIDGDGFVLKSGLSVKLASIEAPQSALRAQNRAAWPFAKEATSALSGLIGGRDVQLFYGGQTRDRYKRAVYTWANETVDSARLFAAESQARAAGRGLWGHEFYAIRSPDPNSLAQYVDSTQIVEGIVLSAADVRGRIYLNFGVDYKTDFTITIAKKNVKKFTKANIDLLALEGARVRVRGWIELINGPSIWVDHPERLEILDRPAPALINGQ